jgi:DNA replication and repair protein RecF
VPLIAEELTAYTSAIPSLNEIQQIFLAYLQQAQAEEIRRGVTLVGPHRDDFLFLVDGVDMNLYGSRGQQRTAALSAKIAEITLMQQATQEIPVLLLDDVMSELDAYRRQQIIKLVDQAQQAILTATDWGDYDATFRQRAKLFTVNQGQLVSHQMT